MADTSRDARFWDGIARKYAADPIADTEGYERTLAETRRHLKASDSVLEFGCGTGATALKLAPSVARYVASDISGEMIAIAREKAAAEGGADVEFAVGTPETASFADESFDAALGFNILHLIHRRAEALASVRRMLKPGGVFISKTPCLKEMNFMVGLVVPVLRAVGRAPYVAFFSAQELEREIAGAGFEIAERARHGSKKKQEPRIYLVARKI